MESANSFLGRVCALGAIAFAATSAFGVTVTAEPDAYIEYIEATGSQYIDTGVNAETGLKARADFSWGSVVNGYDDPIPKKPSLGTSAPSAALRDKTPSTPLSASAPSAALREHSLP